MTFEEFIQEISAEIRQRFPGYEIHEERVEKLQGQSYNGLVIRAADSNIGMTVDLDGLYKQLEDGMDLEEILSKITDIVKSTEYPLKDTEIDDLKDYARMKDKLVLQMVPVEGNQEMLSKVPHKLVKDMAVVYRFLIDQGVKGEASILLTNENIKAFGVTEKQLEADAKEACERNHPLSVRPMESVLFGIPEEEVTEQGLWVVANDTGRYGAAVIAYPDALEKVAEKLGSGFYLIPSSIHEMLAVPDGAEMNAKEIDMMIVGVNNTEVSPEERLTNHSYHYDKEARLFEHGTVYEERKAKEQEEEKAREAAKEQSGSIVREDEEEYHPEEKATVLLVEPGRYPRPVEMSMELESLQQAVGGFIEATYPFEDEMACIICNEEGKINGMELNRALYDEHGNIDDIIAGTFIIAGLKFEGFGSLTPEQMKKYEAQFHQPESFMRWGNHFVAIPAKDRDEKAREAAAKHSPKREKAVEAR